MTKVVIKRAYEDPAPQDGYRVLVDRVWPRGRSRVSLALDNRAPELAPSVTLRKWFSHDAKRWTQFQDRYGRELESASMQSRMKALLVASNGRPITLVYGAKDVSHNHAIILQRALVRLAIDKTACKYFPSSRRDVLVPSVRPYRYLRSSSNASKAR